MIWARIRETRIPRYEDETWRIGLYLLDLNYGIDGRIDIWINEELGWRGRLCFTGGTEVEQEYILRGLDK